MHYVKIKGGQVVEGPIQLSASESDSPNVHWGDDQLRANGWFAVDLSHEKLYERIDYEHPIINGDTISYPRIPLTMDEHVDKWNKKADQNILSEMPSFDELTLALWELIIEDNPERSEKVKAIMETLRTKYYKK